MKAEFPRRDGSGRRAAVLSPFLGLLAAVILSGCHEKPAAATASGPPPPQVQGDTVTFASGAPQTSSLTVEPAQARKLSITHLTGRLYWDDDVTVRIFTPVAGRVKSISVDLGDVVSAGTPLAEIDSPDFGMAVANARTAVGNLAAADKAYTRARELFEHGAAPQKDVEAAQAAYVASVAERDRAEAVLANYGGSDKSTNALYVLRTPLPGVVVDKTINPGQELRADLMLANSPNLFAPHFIVSDPTRLWLQVDASELDIPSLQKGQPLRIYSRAYPDKVFDGVVEKVGDAMDPSTRTIKVRGVVNNPEKLLKAEMYVTVDVTQDLTKLADAGTEIPAKAIFTKNNEHYLFIEESPGRFQRRRVKLGTEKDGRVPVLEGVTAGQRVVTEGCLLLQALVEPSS